MIICPWFFDGQQNGIGRVSAAFDTAFKAAGYQPFILSANDPVGSCERTVGYCYGHNYPAMMMSSLISRFPVPPLIVCMHAGLSPVARVLSHRYRVPYLVFLHGYEAWLPVSARWQWGLGRASLLMSGSSFTLLRFRAHNANLANLPILPTPLGMALNLKADNSLSKLTKPINPQGGRILIVGRLDRGERYKGHVQLIDCMRWVLAERPQTKLIIVGDGNDRQNLMQYAATKDYHQQIEFTGRLSSNELAQCYADSDLFAMPSEGEGFGLVYLEAMAFGLPCICSDVDAAREVVINNQTGFTVDARNCFDLAENILMILRDPVRAGRFGEAGRQRYLENFTMSHFQNRLYQAIAPYLSKS